MPSNPFLDDELFDQLMRRQVQSPVPAHAPVTDLDVARTQIADIESRRGLDPGMPPRDNPIDMLLSILPLGSPMRNPAMRRAAHGFLKQSARALPVHVQEALGDFIKKYPRLASHIQRTSPELKSPTAAGGFSPLLTPHESPRAVLHLNPRLKTSEATAQTLAHEGTHAAQMMRLADRARHAGTPSPPVPAVERRAGAGSPPAGFSERRIVESPFMTKYNQLRTEFGYFKHPMEEAARLSEELRMIPRGSMPNPERRALATERAGDIRRYETGVQQSLGPTGAKPPVQKRSVRNLSGLTPEEMNALIRSLRRDWSP